MKFELEKWKSLLGKTVRDGNGKFGTLKGLTLDGDLLVNEFWWYHDQVNEFVDPNQTKLFEDEDNGQ